MLKTFALRGREEPITLYGPAGLISLFSDLRRIFGKLSYEYTLVELSPGDRLPRDGYVLEVFPVLHGRFAVGYTFLEDERPGRFDVGTADALDVPAGPERGALQRGEQVTLADGRVVTPEQVLGPARRGRKVSITGDTAPCPEVIEAVRNADVLVHEATFLEDEQERARDTLHSTALDAAAAAREADVGLLALTHLSSRYLGRDAAREARTIFPATVVPKDFDTIEVGFEERGGPRLIKGGAKHRRDRQPGPLDEAVPVEEGAT
jgi:ribonuclease Z